MPTEKTEELKTIDEAWNEDVDVEEEVEEEVEDEKKEVEDEEKDEDVTEQVKTGDDNEKEKEENKVDWKALGLDVFEGKSQKEVAEQILFERKQLGHTTNMLGELRREISQLKTKPEKVEKTVEKPKSVLEEIKELDEADTAKFNALYDKNPIKAIMTYGGDTIKDFIAEEVKKSVPDVSGVLQETKDKIEYNSFLSSNDDVTESDMAQIRIFNDEQYLGEQERSYADLYGLAKLWRNKDERAEKVYSLMKKHSTMSFSEACTFVPERKSEVNKEKIKQTVNKNKTTNPLPRTEKKSNAVLDGSFDENWDNA